MRVSNSEIPNFINADMSSSLLSPAISVYQIYGWSSQFVFSGSPVGTLSVEVSCDPFQSEGVVDPTHWTTLKDSPTSISAAGDVCYNVDIAFYNWIRFRYVATSGAGSISGRVNIKGV